MTATSADAVPTAASPLQVEQLPIVDLHPDPGNPRRIAEDELAALTPLDRHVRGRRPGAQARRYSPIASSRGFGGRVASRAGSPSRPPSGTTMDALVRHEVKRIRPWGKGAARLPGDSNRAGREPSRPRIAVSRRRGARAAPSGEGWWALRDSNPGPTDLKEEGRQVLRGGWDSNLQW